MILLLNIMNKSNEKDPKFTVGDYVRIPKYKNIFSKAYVPNWSEETFIAKKTILYLGLMKLVI